jgi:hypothetical protein
MFEGTDTADLLICEVNAYISSLTSVEQRVANWSRPSSTVKSSLFQA